MKKIKFDTGLQEIAIGGGVLRFNPQDPNLYARFLEAADKLVAVEQELVSKGEAAGGSQVVVVLREADRKMKDILNWVFGTGNDFDAILGGVNLLAVGANGQRVVTNLFHALEPVILDSAKACANAQADAAVKKAEARRSR